MKDATLVKPYLFPPPDHLGDSINSWLSLSHIHLLLNSEEFMANNF